MTFFNTEEELKKCVGQRIKEKRGGIVSKAAPFLSNLNIVENIALILEYHREMKIADAEQMAHERLRGVGIDHIGYRREPNITPRERFGAMVVRATLLGGEAVVERPLLILENEDSIEFMLEQLKMAESFCSRIEIFDLASNKGYYGERDV